MFIFLLEWCVCLRKVFNNVWLSRIYCMTSDMALSVQPGPLVLALVHPLPLHKKKKKNWNVHPSNQMKCQRIKIQWTTWICMFVVVAPHQVFDEKRRDASSGCHFFFLMLMRCLFQSSDRPRSTNKIKNRCVSN